MAEISIRKGLDISLAGRPDPAIADAPPSATVAVQPTEHAGLKPRLKVKEGDAVRRGSVLAENKRDTRVKLTAPAAGTVREIAYGPRRVIERIVIEVAAQDEAEPGAAYTVDGLAKVSRDDLLARLHETGMIFHLRQRPFDVPASPEATPKSIFVNAMATAPFRADPDVVVGDQPAAWRAGLAALVRLTEGPVHVVTGAADSRCAQETPDLDRIRKHVFRGPHPAGNTSVHIHHLDPLRPTDVVWTVNAAGLVLIGQTLLDGAPPAHRVIALGGPGVKDGEARHVRVRRGGEIASVTDGRLADGEMRVVGSDLLSGRTLKPGGYLPETGTSLTVLPEGREQELLGWMAPGADKFTASRAFVSAWTGAVRKRAWRLTTNNRGDPRALVVSGWYETVMPMMIMPEFVVRAALARDTTEAVNLGILETVPEDYALCAFICPSKLDVPGIIARGLALIQEEGI